MELNWTHTKNPKNPRTIGKIKLFHGFGKRDAQRNNL